MITTTTWTCRRSSADVPEATAPQVPGIVAVDLDGGAQGWFTGASFDGLADANLSHHRAHRPERLAAARDHVGAVTGTDPARWHMMRQVHGARVAVIDSDVPAGAESRDVDVLVTDLPDRPLVVLTADCLPVLAAGRAAVGVAHAGWRGVVARVPTTLVRALASLGASAPDLRVVIGPGIGPCCYEVGPEVLEAVAHLPGVVETRTRWGTPSLDLRRIARAMLHEDGVLDVRDAGGGNGDGPACTACDERWFSHRRDPAAGRQAGIVVRRLDDRSAG